MLKINEHLIGMETIYNFIKWREEVGIEPTEVFSQKPPNGFEARGVHQDHISSGGEKYNIFSLEKNHSIHRGQANLTPMYLFKRQ
ncbi:hypothetical protein AS592_11190 [Sulfurovum riftiae]|uniref:Uncharacterized protein n=1 Tax=Sulfurovum riftiae TaxID=1630136 RepID=A0A151CJD7_9BACT|nr:hypothetical protein AS592_11190 [Sulfurovum riftiae]